MGHKIVTISIAEGTWKVSKEFAKNTGRTFSSLVRISLEKFMQQETAGAKNV